MNTLLADVALFIAGQSLLLVIIILAVSPIQRVSNRLLAAFVLVKFCKFMLFYFGFGGVQLPPYVFLLQNLAFAAGPLLYLYTLSLIRPSFTWQHRFLWHFLPVLMSVFLSPFIYDIAPAVGEKGFIIASDDPQNIRRSIHIAIGALWFLVYLGLAYRLLPGYEHHLRERYSAIETLTLAWLHRIITVALVAYTVIAVLDVAGMLLGLDNEPRRLVELVCYVVLFYVIAINGLRRGLLLAEPVAPQPSLPESAGEESAATGARQAASETSMVAPKYQRSMLDAQTTTQIVALAETVMREQEPYLESDFKLQQLAALIGVSSHDLSQAINTGGQTYYDYVNGYRAEKARELIDGKKFAHLAMLDIALRVGFNSKSTFYKHFKRRFNYTPAQYRKSLVA